MRDSWLTFQSAPLTEARGDLAASTPFRRNIRFNPLPSPKRGEMPSGEWPRRGNKSFNPLPSPKRGEISSTLDVDRVGSHVSIRSPHRSEGRYLDRVDSEIRRAEAFQSAPLTEARGDLECLRIRRRSTSTSFNPLPSPKRGEISAKCTDGGQTYVSIRSPHRSEGRSAFLL